MGLESNVGSATDSNYWLDPVKIIDIDNISGTPAREGWSANDCALDVKYARLDEETMELLDPDEDPWSMFVMGNFRRNTQGKIEDWGGAFKVRTFLEACGLRGTFTDDEGNLDMQIVNNCINKPCWKISYKSSDINDEGKNKVKTWSGRLFASKEQANKYWLKSLKTGWPKDYLGHPANESMQGRDPEPAKEVAATAFPTDL
tara:strand:- start:1399 stop:2004 length:606 start_codon:yes stop_codon:yes gene_type:complete